MSTNRIESRLHELGFDLPPVAPAAGLYEAGVRTGNLIHLSGGIPVDGDRLILGKVGEGVSIEEGQRAAKLCVLGRLAVIKSMVGSLDAVSRIVSVTGYVNAGPEFADQPKVIDGASELLVEAFGEVGRHSRAAVGCASLPLGVAVEISMVVEVS